MDYSQSDAKAYNETSESKPSPSTSNAVENNITKTIPIPEEPVEICKEPVKFLPESLFYDMSGEKIMLIFSHRYYAKNDLYKSSEQLPPRENTERDVKSLNDVFTRLGFTVQNFEDLKYKQIRDVAEKMVNDRDHRATSCLAVAILTHGDVGDLLYAHDKSYYLSDILKIFQHDKLMNKPKLFFIQACRGPLVDSGKLTYHDGFPILLHVPTHIDFLISRSTVENHMAYRQTWGSWYIQAHCKIFEKYYEDMDILQLLTLVTKNVAYNLTTHNVCPLLHEKKATPETRYTLTKLLKFSKVPQIEIESVYIPSRPLLNYSFITGVFGLLAGVFAGFFWK